MGSGTENQTDMEAKIGDAERLIISPVGNADLSKMPGLHHVKNLQLFGCPRVMFRSDLLGELDSFEFDECKALWPILGKIASKVVIAHKMSPTSLNQLSVNSHIRKLVIMGGNIRDVSDIKKMNLLALRLSNCARLLNISSLPESLQCLDVFLSGRKRCQVSFAGLKRLKVCMITVPQGIIDMSDYGEIMNLEFWISEAKECLPSSFENLDFVRLQFPSLRYGEVNRTAHGRLADYDSMLRCYCLESPDATAL